LRWNCIASSSVRVPGPKQGRLSDLCSLDLSKISKYGNCDYA
jgi:hypothetical protein